MRTSVGTLTMGTVSQLSGTMLVGHATSGHVVMPNALTGTLVGFSTSADGVTFRTLYGADGDPVYIATSAAGSRSYPLPAELFGAYSFALQAGTVQAAARSFTVYLKGS